MQYLLTEQEYKAATQAKRLAELEVQDAVYELRQTILELCKRVAMSEPINTPWNPDGSPSPWGCIRAKDDAPSYCDECPVRHVCPYKSKEYSK